MPNKLFIVERVLEYELRQKFALRAEDEDQAVETLTEALHGDFHALAEKGIAQLTDEMEDAEEAAAFHAKQAKAIELAIDPSLVDIHQRAIGPELLEIARAMALCPEVHTSENAQMHILLGRLGEVLKRADWPRTQLATAEAVMDESARKHKPKP